MALATNALPYGLRDVRLTPIDAAGTLGTPVDLPAARVFSFSEAEDFETLRGDDGVVAIRGKGATVSWNLESGGVSMAAWQVLSGGALTTTGTTPNQIRRYRKLGTDTKPYFKAEGQSFSDSGGDVHGVLYKARASDTLEGEFSDGTFFLTKAGGTGIPDLNNILYDFVQNETATTIP
jgi:hypothetical protein